MILIDDMFRSVEEYREAGQTTEVARPEACPGCGRRHSFWKHTPYWRKASDGEEVVDVRIQRFRCKHPDCHLIVSCVFSFLCPYRRYTAAAVAQSVTEYATAPLDLEARTSYRSIADNRGGSRMSVFRWVDLLSARAASLQYQLQKEYLLRGFSWQAWLRLPQRHGCPNARFAHATEKRTRLDALSLLVEMLQLFFGIMTGALEQLHAYFLKSSERLQLIFTGRDIDLLSHHRVGRAF
ncbi:MAG: DUF6431 domain-containing protein [Ktedonobacteraceae bacterium]